MPRESRPNKEALKRKTRMTDLKSEVDVEVATKAVLAPPLQQVFLLTEILKELRMIRENL